MTDRVAIFLDDSELEPREDVGAALVEAAEEAGVSVTVGWDEPGRASIVFAFDEVALARAPSGAFRVAVLPAFDASWRDPAADAVFVSHEAIASRLDARARRRAHVVGPIAPPGFGREASEAGAAELDLAREGPVVVVLPSAVMAMGPTPLLVQLSLVGAPASFLFDVGRDPELAEAVRTFGRGHVGEGSRVGLFASEEQKRLFARADLVVGTGSDVALAAAVGAGAGLVVLEPGGATGALEASGCAVVAKGGSTLAVALDEALARSEALCQRARALEASDGARRALAKARELAVRPAPTRPQGLPTGIEWLPGEGELPGLVAAAELAEPAAPSLASEPEGPSLDERIEAELAALKKRLD